MTAATTMQIPGFLGDVIAPDHDATTTHGPCGTAPSIDDLG